jgi:hypothetical protein
MLKLSRRVKVTDSNGPLIFLLIQERGVPMTALKVRNVNTR